MDQDQYIHRLNNKPEIPSSSTGHMIDPIKVSGHPDDLMKTRIANHPSYPDLLAAYIQCQKVGAPPETASLLEEIGVENHTMSSYNTEIGADPELDYFMESYCKVLKGFKEELSKPLNEATTFLSNIESQLNTLCEGTLTKTLEHYGQYSDDQAHETDIVSGHHDHDHDHHGEEITVVGHGDRTDHDRLEAAWSLGGGVGPPPGEHGRLKERLLRKYSGYLTMLKTEFLKKRKKVELPKPARTTLLQWWNAHSRWPYPTEEEKVKLAEETGLEQKQINNWFVNQRKRHWKPSEDIKFALVDDVSSNNSLAESAHPRT